MLNRIYIAIFKSPFAVFAISMVAAWLAIVAGTFILLHMALPGELAELESLRSDAAMVDPRYSEDIAGLVATENRRLAKRQRYNHVWWSALMIPNQWDSVERIEIGVALTEPEQAD